MDLLGGAFSFLFCSLVPDPIISGLQRASNDVDLQKEGVKGCFLDSSSQEAG